MITAKKILKKKSYSQSYIPTKPVKDREREVEKSCNSNNALERN